MKKMSRMECSKECRRALNRHGVDLTNCQYIVAGYEVRLNGWLCHVDTTDFTAQQIEEMLKDFRQTLPGFSVYGDMENWRFNSETIMYLADGLSKGDAEESNEVYVIDLDDYDFEAS